MSDHAPPPIAEPTGGAGSPDGPAPWPSRSWCGCAVRGRVLRRPAQRQLRHGATADAVVHAGPAPSSRSLERMRLGTWDGVQAALARPEAPLQRQGAAPALAGASPHGGGCNAARRSSTGAGPSSPYSSGGRARARPRRARTGGDYHVVAYDGITRVRGKRINGASSRSAPALPHASKRLGLQLQDYSPLSHAAAPFLSLKINRHTVTEIAFCHLLAFPAGICNMDAITAKYLFLSETEMSFLNYF